MGKLFGTDGVRGIPNQQLTPELALRLGMAVGTYFGEGAKILVGRDVRCGGDMIVHAAIAGLLSAGVKVYYAGYAPTPAIQYNVRVGGFDGAVIVTASHNPPEYNGIKVVGPQGIEASRDAEREIEEIYFEQKFRPAPWSHLVYDVKPYPEALDVYINGVVEHVDDKLIKSKGFKVVVDCANSVGALATPKILEKLGVKVVSVNCHLDPLFLGREPEPTPDTLANTAKVVVDLNADLGIGHDGDADRAILIDDRGRVWWGDRTGSLLAAYVADKYRNLPRKVYTGVSSSILVEEYLAQYGIEVKWTPVGSIYISYSLLKEGGVAGFEENGGYIHPPHQLVRDGAMTLALFLELMAKENKRASELFDRLPRYEAIKIKVPMAREKALKAVEAVKEAFKEYRQVTIDGVKVFGEKWWVLVRPSGTEPVLRIMAEAPTREEAEQLVSKVVDIVKSTVGA